MAAGTASATPGGRPPLGAARRRWGEDVIRALLFLAAMLSILTTIGIVVALAVETFGEFFADPIVQGKGADGATSIGGYLNGIADFVFGTDWSPNIKPLSFGVLPLVAGTLLTTVIALIVAVPLGLGAAIYLSEYADPRVRKVLKPILELLAGVPTIVFGYFALTFVTPVILQAIFGQEDVGSFNALSGGLVMGFMVLPTVASVSEDALSAVPGALREGAYGLGASKLKVSTRIVVPAALSGIVAAFVLGISRAIGETMIVLLASGAQPNLTFNPLEAVETMTAFIGQQATGDIPVDSVRYKTIFAVGALLFLMTFVMNAISIRFVRRYREVYE